LLVGAISIAWASDEVKVSVNVAAPDDTGIVAVTADVPSSWKFPFGVWIVAVYGTVKTALLIPKNSQLRLPPGESDPVLLPEIVAVPEVIANVALKLA
jgi:hypothetical protein